MNINTNTLQQLYNKYKVTFLSDYPASLDVDVFIQIINFIEAQLPNYFNWDNINENPIVDEELNDLLKQSLPVNYELQTIQFDALNAKLSCAQLAQKFTGANELKLASMPKEQGIQERFLKSQLAENKPLSQLDIQRHIIQTNMIGHIGVVEVNSDALNLFFTHSKTDYEQSKTITPYSIALMVNYNPNGEAQWASVVITIDTQNQHLHYEMTHDADVTEEQQHELITNINSAIKFQATSLITGLPIEAYPNSTISTPTYKKINKANTYHLLHQLYNSEALTDVVQERENAQLFKSIDAELDTIKQAIYEQQIQAIKIKPAIFNLFQAEEQPQHPMVSEVIQDIRISDSKITFPRVQPSSLLVAQDYQLFILLLKQKFHSDDMHNNLSTLELRCTDLSAFQGLARLKDHIFNLPFDTLILTLSQSLHSSDKSALKFNLKLALISLSQANLTNMQLHDANHLLTEQDIIELTTFIEQNDCAIALLLPNHFASSSYQRRIDCAVSQAILNRNARNFLNQNPSTNITPVVRPLRTRPQLPNNNLAIDVELQQEVQVEVAVEVSTRQESSVPEAEQDSIIYTLQRFKVALMENKFSDESKSYLIPCGNATDAIWCNWLGYFNTTEADAGIHISKSALEELMLHADRFQYGIGFLKQGDEYSNTPAGFKVKKKGIITYIDFDPALKLIVAPNALAVHTDKSQPNALLSTTQIQKWFDANPQNPFKIIWDEQLDSKNKYNQDVLHALQAAVPIIAQLPEEQVSQLFNLCHTDGTININKFNVLLNDSAQIKNLLNLAPLETANLEQYLNTLFSTQKAQVHDYILYSSSEHHNTPSPILDVILSPEEKTCIDIINSQIQTINPDSLLQLYLKTGIKGVKDLSALLYNAGDKHDLYQKIIAAISMSNGSYQQIINKEFQEALKIYSALPANEQQFFFSLFEQHAHYNLAVDFTALINSFIQFKQELHSLAKPGQVFQLPEQCALTQVKSLPLALSRIITLIRHVKEEDRQTQLLESHTLDLSSTGMIQAITRNFTHGKRWNFIAGVMQLNQQHEQGRFYRAASDWKTLSGTTAEQAKEFLRYVGFQLKHKPFSFDYYKHVVHTVQQGNAKEPWSEKSTLLFYKLIAASSIDNGQTSAANTQQSIAQFDVLFAKINVPPNPGGVAHRLKGTDNIRLQLLETLTALKNPPPLLVLSRLVTLIANSLSSVISAVSNGPALDEANRRLIKMSSTYGHSIYKGMECYQDSDYDNTQLFFEHMTTIDAIYSKSHIDNADDADDADNADNADNMNYVTKHQIGVFLLQLISIFHLKSDKTHPEKDNLSAVFNTVSTLVKEKSLELLGILTYINPDKYFTLPPLSHTHLLELIHAVAAHPDTSIIDVIKTFKADKQPLVDYFAPRYLQNYGKNEVPIEVKEKIERGFDEAIRPTIEDILLHFTDKNDSSEYHVVVDKLINICKTLPKLEKYLFIAKLNQTQGLYSHPTPLAAEDNCFKLLLNLIAQQNSPNELLNFIASSNALNAKLAQEGKPANENEKLDTKAVLLIQDILPLIKYQHELPFSSLEITPRLHDWLLRTPAAQLKEDYPKAALDLVEKLAAIVSENQIAHRQFLELFDSFVSHYDPTQGEMMPVLHQFADQIIPMFALIDDQNVVLSLCIHFNEDEHLQPEDLLKLIATIKTVNNTEHQKLLFHLAVNLLNNNKGYILGDGSGTDFTLICQLAKDPQFITTLNTFYQKPPFPDLNQLITIHNKAVQENTYNQSIQRAAQEFDKNPCHRELDINGFHLDEAIKQIEQFKGYVISREELEQFHKKTVSMRELSSEELLTLLNNTHRNNNANPDIETLVAAAAELFYRSQGRNAYNADGAYKLGSSMEINTTQYLAILSLLKAPGHVTSQIGTGEGKSRIMMIANVCQWALGNTVDFVTSDAQLATRDYIEYQAYFEMVGAKTAMIFAHSSPSSYQIGGINFSDPANLSLFRNKAKSLGLGELVLSSEKSHRTLMLDEADKTYFDVADTRFNFSKEGDTSIQEMSWVYPLLMAYFEQEQITVDKNTISPQQLFYANTDLSREHFIAFAGSHCSKKEYAQLKALSDNQIEQWQVSAVTASQLEFNKDFIITPDQLIATPKGPYISSEAQLLFANRVAQDSKFSFGVHQCLHARLNRLRLTPEKTKNKGLQHALAQCEHEFYMADEKQIIYSSTSKNLIDDYHAGTLKAVTGTVGSLIEKAEAKKLYNNMHFIEVPRARGMMRKDKGIQLYKDEHAQLNSLIINIKKAQINNQPILIIAENDEESARLFALLQKDFPEDLQIINSQLSAKEEQVKTRNAGLPRMITVSTDMIGRGTDIELRKKTLKDGTLIDAQQYGLNVMVTYLPRVRDLAQIIGRSGRFGAKGETSLILNESSLLKKLNLHHLPADYIKNANAFIEREQTKMDRKAQVERLLKNHIGDFRMALQDNFFEQMLTQVPNKAKKELAPCWTSFFEKSDKAWNELWPHIQVQLQQRNITEIELNEIEQMLHQYQESIQKEWSILRNKVANLDINCLDSDKNASDLLLENVPDFTLDDEIKQLLNCFIIAKKEITSDNNRFKKILGGVFAFIGVALGVALIATGVLAPLGIGLILTVAIVTLGSGFIGGVIGALSGSMADYFFKKEASEVLEIDLKEHTVEAPSSYANIMKKPLFKNRYESSKINDEESSLDKVQNKTLDATPHHLQEGVPNEPLNKGTRR